MSRTYEKKVRIFKVNEVFRSIQGEGIYQGQPTIFARFTGCNLRCSWCDTIYAYNEGNRLSLTELMSRIGKYPERVVCLTGGEPLLQEHLPKLTTLLLNDGFLVHLETNGSLDVGGFLDKTFGVEPRDRRRKIVISLDVKTPSSGESGSFLFDNLAILEPWDQLKFIADDVRDMDYARSFTEKNQIRSPVIIQPSDQTDLGDMVKLFLEYDWPPHLDIRFIAQLHKMIWGKDKKGV